MDYQFSLMFISFFDRRFKILYVLLLFSKTLNPPHRIHTVFISFHLMVSRLFPHCFSSLSRPFQVILHYALHTVSILFIFCFCMVSIQFTGGMRAVLSPQPM